ncbi:MAG TPA: hypothetical protein VNZ22_04220, partial [Bacillota bacterium]|nr:hypothetical protein [Bacillota bacterium]
NSRSARVFCLPHSLYSMFGHSIPVLHTPHLDTFGGGLSQEELGQVGQSWATAPKKQAKKL